MLLRSAVLLALLSCTTPPPPAEVAVERAFVSETFPGCLLASPLDAAGGVVVATGDGQVALLDPETGATRVRLSLPHPDGELAHVIATPVRVPNGDAELLVVAWQDVAAGTADPATAPRSGHHVAVIDLATFTLAPDFPVATLAASEPTWDGTGTVPFVPNNALSRSRLVHAPAGAGLGHVYVSFGNARDIQPWHGWVFELDLDAWRRGESATSAVLLTTPEDDCGTPGVSGDRDMICGGGVWAPAGPLFVEDAGGPALIVPTGNGALDLDTGELAHTLMRVRLPGLRFEAGCDAAACADFDALAPSDACLGSCADLFVPRLLPGDPPLGAPACEGLSFFACYAALDWDLGANTPARAELAGGPVLVLPAKDGAVYLIDGEHLGTLLDRHEVIAPCGSAGRCDADWAGSMVTQPVITEDADGTPLAIIATFLPGEGIPAGLVGLRIESAPSPHLVRAWEAPSFETPEALTRFRRHPSGVALAEVAGEVHALVVEQGRLGSEPGHLHVVRVTDGELRALVDLDGPGQRYGVPLVVPRADGARAFVASCDHGNAGPGHLEAWDLSAR